MKNILIAFTLLVTLFSTGFAKDVITKTSFKVSGNCDMCKERIEKAAKIEGVKNAVWNQDTHLLTVAFAPEKVTLEKIQQSIANTGYDTEKFKAPESAYNNLPKCCQYEK